jgi:hypothetical protein
MGHEHPITPGIDDRKILIRRRSPGGTPGADDSRPEVAMNRRVFVTVVTAGIITLAGRAFAQGGGPSGGRPRWGQEAEKEFRLGRGMGPKLMTEEEWKQRHEKMRTLSGEERERYRREMHDKMVQRAKERGMAMPAEPGPHGRGGAGPR